MAWNRLRRYKLARAVSGGLVVAAVLGGVLGTTKLAQADPHAVFYTAIGQQQLFFNVLAALDQADYVETEFTRENLVEQRAEEDTEPPFEDEEFPLTEATDIGQEVTSPSDPGIADLLVRSINLEGNDLYSDQLVRTFGAESARRNSTSELVVNLCEYGLGIIRCDKDFIDLDSLTVEEEQTIGRMICDNGLVEADECDRLIVNMSDLGLSDSELKAAIKKMMGVDDVFVDDPLAWARWSYEKGSVAALKSGEWEELPGGEIVDVDQIERQRRVANNIKEPYSFSPTIYAWQRFVADLGGGATRDYHQQALKELLDYGAGLYNPANTYEYPYKDIVLDTETGLPVIYDETAFVSPGDPPLVPPEAIDLAEATERILYAPARVNVIAEAAAARVAYQQAMIEDEGLLADVTVTGAGTAGEIGEISLRVENPVAMREADVYSLPIALALLDTSQQASALAGLDEPGSAQLVRRSEGEPASPGDGVAGAQSTGQVLGILDLFGTGFDSPLFNAFDDFDYDAAKRETSPAANIVAPHLEHGLVHTMRVLTGGRFRGGGGGGGAAAVGVGCGGFVGCP